MGILLWLMIGIVLAASAKLVMPGPDAGGMYAALPIGIGGALLGGTLSTLYLRGSALGIEAPGVMAAIAGSMIVLFGYRSYAMRGAV